MAKEEGGIINVYAGSGKMLKTGKAFLAKYPDLKLEVYDLDQDEAKGKIKTENETGNITADVLHTKDTAGEIYYDYLPMGYIETYYPTDLVANIPDNLLTYGLPFYSSMNLGITTIRRSRMVARWITGGISFTSKKTALPSGNSLPRTSVLKPRTSRC